MRRIRSKWRQKCNLWNARHRNRFFCWKLSVKLHRVRVHFRQCALHCHNPQIERRSLDSDFRNASGIPVIKRYFFCTSQQIGLEVGCWSKVAVDCSRCHGTAQLPGIRRRTGTTLIHRAFCGGISRGRSRRAANKLADWFVPLFLRLFFGHSSHLKVTDSQSIRSRDLEVERILATNWKCQLEIRLFEIQSLWNSNFSEILI